MSHVIRSGTITTEVGGERAAAIEHGSVSHCRNSGGQPISFGRDGRRG